MIPARVKQFVLQEEGGWYDGSDPRDPNPTMNGIIQATYDRWRLKHGLPIQSVQLIGNDEWDSIAESMFWRPAGCHLWPEPLNLVMFDPAFNAGPKQALKFLQRAVAAQADGIFGPVTMRKVLERCEAGHTRQLCIRVQGQRVNFYKYLASKDKDQAENLDGWLGRVKRLSKFVGIA